MNLGSGMTVNNRRPDRAVVFCFAVWGLKDTIVKGEDVIDNVWTEIGE